VLRHSGGASLPAGSLPHVRAAVTAGRHIMPKAFRLMIFLAPLDMMTWPVPGPNRSRWAAISSITQSPTGTTRRDALVFSGAGAPFCACSRTWMRRRSS
jgi:hypothetical protein